MKRQPWHITRQTGTGERITVGDIAFHRNGTGGEGFHVIHFTMKDGRFTRNMVATLFDGAGQCAVLDVDDLARGHIGFAWGNTWRGDHFESALREAVTLLNETPFNQVYAARQTRGAELAGKVAAQ
jgi:hypothetical protein